MWKKGGGWPNNGKICIFVPKERGLFLGECTGGAQIHKKGDVEEKQKMMSGDISPGRSM